MSLDTVSQKTWGQTVFHDFDSDTHTQKDDCKAFKSTLIDHDYTDKAICKALSIESLNDISSGYYHYYDQYVLTKSSAHDLIRLFLIAMPLDDKTIHGLFDKKDIQQLQAWGILIEDKETSQWRSQVQVFPFLEHYFVTDLAHLYLLWPQIKASDPVMYIGEDSQGLV